MAQLCQPDDNLVPGQTYTFQFLNSNYIETISTNTLTQDITNNAPSFIGSLQVTTASTAQSVLQQGSLSSLYDIQFTYQGDGTDVVSDVANELIAAVKTGSSDSISFVGAVPDTATTTDISAATVANAASTAASQASSTVSQAISSALSSTVGNVTKQAASSVQDLLTPVEIAVGILAIVVIAIIFAAGKSGGVSGGPAGFDIGG